MAGNLKTGIEWARNQQSCFKNNTK